MRASNPAANANLLRVASIVGFAAGYEFLSRSGLVYQAMFPSLVSIFASLLNDLARSAFYANLLQTVAEVAVGFGIGTLGGVVGGILLSKSRLLAAIFNPWIHYLAPSPKVVFLPALMLLFGADIGGKAALAAISAFFPIAIGTCSAMGLVPIVLIRTATVLGATPWQTVTKVYLPAMAESLANSVRFGFGVSVIGALLGEIKASNLGLGHLIIQSYNNFQIADMYAFLTITFGLAMATNAILARMARALRRPFRFPRWRQRPHSAALPFVGS